MRVAYLVIHHSSFALLIIQLLTAKVFFWEQLLYQSRSEVYITTPVQRALGLLSIYSYEGENKILTSTYSVNFPKTMNMDFETDMDMIMNMDNDHWIWIRSRPTCLLWLISKTYTTSLYQNSYTVCEDSQLVGNYELHKIC